MIKDIIWNRIAEPIINEITNDSIDKARAFLDEQQKNRFKNKFLISLEESLLNRYGDEAFYNDLSKLINELHILDKIYKRCFKIESNDIRTDEEFINNIVEKGSSRFHDKNNLHDAIKYIFEVMFNVLNQPEFDDTRIIINTMRKLNNELMDNIIKSIASSKDSPENFEIKPKTKLNKIFTSLPTDYKSDLIGRRDIIEKIKMLINDKGIVVLSGMGGIGKTTIVKYFFGIETIYDYKGFVSYDGTMNSSLANAFENHSGIQFEHDSTADEKCIIIENVLNNTDAKKLLVVDNINALITEDKNIAILTKLNCDVLITSRCELFSKDAIISLSFLGEEECMKLFKKYYSLEEDDEKIRQIINLAGLHTLTIELLAKTGDIGNYRLNELLEKLHEYGFDLRDISEKVTTDWNDRKTEERLFEHLKKVFKLSKLSEEEKKLLEKITLLTKSNIYIKVVKDALNLIDLNSLKALIEKGWLEKDKDVITIHNIIWEIVDSQCELEEHEILTIIGKIANILHDEPSDNANLDQYLAPMDILFNRFKNLETMEIIGLAHNVASIYEDKYEFNKALEYLNYSSEIMEKLYGNEHPLLATIYYNISKLYYSKSNFDKTIRYANDALRILKVHKKGDDNHLTACILASKANAFSHKKLCIEAVKLYHRCIKIYNILPREYRYGKSNIYGSLGHNYYSLGYQYSLNRRKANSYYDKAWYYFTKAYLMNKRDYGEECIENINILKGLGEVSEVISKLDKAENYLLKAISICHQSEIKYSPSLGRIYGALSNVYVSKGDQCYNDRKEYSKSLKYAKKALNILENIYEEPHTDIGGTYNAIGMISEKLGEYGNALYNYKKAMEVTIITNSDRYMPLGNIYNNLAKLFNNAPLKNDKRAIFYIKKALELYKNCGLCIEHDYVQDCLDGYKTITKTGYEY